MPITAFQREVLLLLKHNRNPNSYVAGGVAIHRNPASVRRSNDIDFFHDTDEAVRKSADADPKILRENGYILEILIDQPGFVRAVAIRNRESLKLEWVRDTAFRFFPVIDDNELGFRLHDADLAVNKCLALANRNEVRDIIDLIELHKTSISLAAACWAACGKDPGFTPGLLIDCIRRHSIIRTEQLAAESLTVVINPVELKRTWLSILDAGQETLNNLPPKDLGCIYLDSTGNIIHPLKAGEIGGAVRHFGSVGGSWPRLI